MNTKAKIGTGQMFLLLLLSRTLTAITFSPTLNDGHLNGEWLVNILLTAFFILVFSVPAFLLYRKYPSFNLVELTESFSKGFSKVISFFYAVVFLLFSAFTLSRFDIFTTSVIYPEKDMTVLLVIAIFMCGYAAYLGLEAVSRAGIILFGIITFGVLVLFVSVAGEIDFLNLTPIFYYPFGESVLSGFSAAGRTVEILLFLFLYSRANGDMKKSFIAFFFLFIICFILLFFFLNGVSGEFADTQLFPFYSLAVIARFPFFERLDSIITAIWIFSVLIKCSLLIYLSTDLIVFTFKGKNRIPFLFFSCVIISAFTLFFSQNLIVHKFVSASYITDILIIGFGVVIPFVVFILKNISDKKGMKVSK